MGANGCGKSSLFALLQGELHADAGDCTRPAGWETGPRRPADPGRRPARHRVRHWTAIANCAGSGAIWSPPRRPGTACARANWHARLEAIGGYAAESRAARLLHGLGFAPGDERRPVNSYSGGWRMRLAPGPHPDVPLRPAAARRAHQPPGSRRGDLAGGLAQGLSRAP